jgi:hypothetical protein
MQLRGRNTDADCYSQPVHVVELVAHALDLRHVHLQHPINHALDGIPVAYIGVVVSNVRTA